MFSVETRLPAVATHCIGCPSGGGSSAVRIAVAIVLVVVGIAVVVAFQRQDRKERQGIAEPRAASLLVAIGRAVGILLIVIGILTAVV